jgi:Tfp pilus assembly protein PilP
MMNRNFLIIGLLAGTALAQTAATPAKTATPTPSSATKSTAAPTTKPAAATKTTTATPAATSAKTSAKPAVKPASQLLKPSTTMAPKKSVAVSPKPKPVTPVVPKKAEVKEAKPAVKKEVKETKAPVKTAARRDPFISPIRLQEDKMKSTSICTTGARCLIIDQVVLKGIVKTTSGMIAMVENAAKKQYNLKEKDPVFNGFVLKISGDTVVFRETITDNLGNQTAKEVVKRVTAPVI